MRKFLPFFLSLLVVSGCAKLRSGSESASNDGDKGFNQLVDEYLAGYLAWRPQTGVTLGFHQYDGKVTDLSRGALDTELSRLKTFERRLGSIDRNTISKRAGYDYRILLSVIQ